MKDTLEEFAHSLDFTPFKMKFTAKMFEGISTNVPFPFPSDFNWLIYDFCYRHKIKTEAPKDHEGLYTILIIHIETPLQAIKFQQRFLKTLRDISNKFPV